MRAIIAVTIVMLGVSSGAPEPEYASLLGGYFHGLGDRTARPLVEIESSAHRADRLAVTAAHVTESADDPSGLTGISPLLAAAEIPQQEVAPDQAPNVSLNDVCNALFMSAQENNLPVPFFANLIWQESRLRDDAVSRVGAQGIAQFMPEAAMDSGLSDPFDPLQAIPASARLLHDLRAQFGNLGYAAAAYNAGAHRVSDWLSRGRTLPRETLNYVLRITGHSAEQWRAAPPHDDALMFTEHLPCLAMPAFAELQQTQTQEADEEAEAKPAKTAEKPAAAELRLPRREVERRHARSHGTAARVADRARHDTRHHAERVLRATHRA